MSHHLDSPASRSDARLNLTDIYLFDGQSGTALAMMVNTSLAGDSRNPGFHPEARYEFKVHLDNAQYENLTYRLVFGAGESADRQKVELFELTGADARDDAANGTLIAEGRTGEIITGSSGSGVQVWAGAASDPFYLDLHQLSHIIDGLQHRRPIDLAEWTLPGASSSFSGSDVYAIVLEVSDKGTQMQADRKIGVWGTTKLATDAGGWRQINRAAIPMMWPLFRALGGTDDSNEYERDSNSHPADDPANDGERVTEMVTAVSQSTGTANPEAYAKMVAQQLLPDLLPYTVGTPAAFSFAGFNGRTLADNAPEVMYGLITNSAFPTGLTSASAKETRQDKFPYVVPVNPAD